MIYDRYARRALGFPLKLLIFITSAVGTALLLWVCMSWQQYHLRSLGSEFTERRSISGLFLVEKKELRKSFLGRETLIVWAKPIMDGATTHPYQIDDRAQYDSLTFGTAVKASTIQSWYYTGGTYHPHPHRSWRLTVSPLD